MGPCGPSSSRWSYEDEQALLIKRKKEGKCSVCGGSGEVFSHHKPGGAGWAWKTCIKCKGTGKDNTSKSKKTK